MLQYKIKLHFEASDGDMYEQSSIEEVSGDTLERVTDDAIAKIGDWQRFQEAELERANNVIPEK